MKKGGGLNDIYSVHRVAHYSLQQLRVGRTEAEQEAAVKRAWASALALFFIFSGEHAAR